METLDNIPSPGSLQLYFGYVPCLWAEPIQISRTGGPLGVLGINLREVYGNLSSNAVCVTETITCLTYNMEVTPC
jgi:hypothetical protein